jgi:hypothetical protein
MRISTFGLAAIAGFLGGWLGSHITTVYAQGPGLKILPSEILQSKDFVLMDGSGRKRGEWRTDPSGQPVLRLFDSQGQVIWDTTGRPGPQLLHQP